MDWTGLAFNLKNQFSRYVEMGVCNSTYCYSALWYYCMYLCIIVRAASTLMQMQS